MPAMLYKPTFLRQIVAVFFVLTRPASKQVNPRAINMTKNPCTKKENVLNT